MTNKYIILTLGIFCILTQIIPCIATDDIVSANNTIVEPDVPQTHIVYPGESIQAAIDNTNPGDIIYVERGVYPENITVGMRTLIADYAQINGITITSSSTIIEKFYIKGSGIYVLDNCWDCIIKSCIIDSNKVYDGIMGSENVGNFTIQNNTIYNANNGIFVASSYDCNIINNLVYNSQTGMSFYQTDGVNIKGNTVRYCNTGLLFNGYCAHYIIDKNVIKLNKIGIKTEAIDNEGFTCSKVYNNYFNNNVNVKADPGSMYKNEWNDKKISKHVNIIKGRHTGGNYWSSCKGTDKNKDGIYDKSYTIIKGNVDKYPLAANSFSRSLVKECFKFGCPWEV